MFTAHPAPLRTGLEAGGKLRVQTTFGDGVELVEEYDASTDKLLTRKWRARDALNRQLDWEVEVGRAPDVPQKDAAAQLRAAAANPVWCARDATDAWEWHVLNIPYEESTYSVTVSDETQELVLRTTNRKFFKRWRVPGMARLGLRLAASPVSFRHSGTTLVVRYLKPPQAIDQEEQERQHRRKLQVELKANGGLAAAGETPECKQS
ncbi:DPCD protein family-domain-containing protein [Tribonema minus]|uniref:Protein DPCD n=1 Tax=Tribonema minus TaxID=303371 RepID=A0A836CLT6_9STRA|nr:DPCD protein family-domain-containing protein [Tribonema minus]